MSVKVEYETRVGRPNSPSCDPTLEPRKEGHLWAAGFLEGRGSFGHTPTGLRLVVQMKDRAALDRLRNWFGGTVISPFGSTFRWTLTGNRVMALWTKVGKYVTKERRQTVHDIIHGSTARGSEEEEDASE